MMIQNKCFIIVSFVVVNFNTSIVGVLIFIQHFYHNTSINSFFFLDWKVLCYILTEVPQILKHKALILSGNEDFDPAYNLVSTLCFLVNILKIFYYFYYNIFV